MPATPMNPDDVPDELIDLARRAFNAAPQQRNGKPTRMRHALAAVLPAAAQRNAEAAQKRTPPNLPDLPNPRRFRLVRDVDVTGMSGTGIVADGVLWPDHTATIRWRGDMPSTVNWGHIEHAMRVHGHGGLTRVEWLDPIEVVDEDSAQAWVEGSDY